MVNGHEPTTTDASRHPRAHAIAATHGADYGTTRSGASFIPAKTCILAPRAAAPTHPLLGREVAVGVPLRGRPPPRTRALPAHFLAGHPQQALNATAACPP